MERAIVALTILLALVGALVVFGVGGESEQFFEDASAYTRAKTDGAISEALPDMPPCARGIAVGEGGASVAFTCEDESERRTFIENMKKSFDWNIRSFEGGRVLIERITQ